MAIADTRKAESGGGFARPRHDQVSELVGAITALNEIGEAKLCSQPGTFFAASKASMSSRR
jgi:hypothetical protein